MKTCAIWLPPPWSAWMHDGCKRFQDIQSNCLLFDTQGQRLLMNTVAVEVESGSDVPVPGAARLWDVATDELRDLKSAGNGPVAFADDVPRQLVVADDDASFAWLDLTIA